MGGSRACEGGGKGIRGSGGNRRKGTEAEKHKVPKDWPVSGCLESGE